MSDDIVYCPECAKKAGYLPQHSVSAPWLVKCPECGEEVYCFKYKKPEPPPPFIPIKDRPAPDFYCPNDGSKLEFSSRSNTDEFRAWYDCPKCKMPWEVTEHHASSLDQRPGDSFGITFTYWK